MGFMEAIRFAVIVVANFALILIMENFTTLTQKGWSFDLKGFLCTEL